MPIFPALNEQPPLRQWQFVLDAAGILFCVPLVLVGFVWLVSVSNVTLLLANLPAIIILVIVILLFARLPYFVIDITLLVVQRES